MNNFYTIKQIKEFVNSNGLKDAGYAENSIRGMKTAVSKLKKAFEESVSFESAHLGRSVNNFINIFVNAYRGEPSTHLYIAKLKAFFKVMDGGKKRATKPYKLRGKQSFTALNLAMQIKPSNVAPETSNFGLLEFILVYLITVISLQAGMFIGGLIY